MLWIKIKAQNWNSRTCAVHTMARCAQRNPVWTAPKALVLLHIDVRVLHKMLSSLTPAVSQAPTRRAFLTLLNRWTITMMGLQILLCSKQIEYRGWFLKFIHRLQGVWGNWWGGQNLYLLCPFFFFYLSGNMCKCQKVNICFKGK